MKKSSAFFLCAAGYLILAFLFYSEPLGYNPNIALAVLFLPFFIFYLFVTNTHQKVMNLVPQRLKFFIKAIFIIVGYPIFLFSTWINIEKLVGHIESSPARVTILVFSVIVGIFYMIKLVKEHLRKST